MSHFVTLPSKMSMNVSKSKKELEEEKQVEIKIIEESMRILFFNYKISPSIVDQYNALERKWKKLTGYQP